MTPGPPRAGPYLAPRVSGNVLARAQEHVRRLEAQIQDLEARNKELKDENEKLVVEAKVKDAAMKVTSERVERLAIMMGGMRSDRTDE